MNGGIYTMDYYSTIKKNEILLFVITWINFEGIMPSEMLYREKQVSYDIT